MKKVLLIGAGPLKEDSFLLEKRSEDYFFVACDGGYQHFLNQNIVPDLFVGDFDTLPEKELKAVKEKIKLNVKKDDTDTFFAIKKLLEKGYKTFEFYGCLGGRIDHTFANIQLLAYLLKNGVKGYLFDENNQIVVHMIQNSCIRLKPLKAGFLSVFSYNGKSSGVDIKNLLYELHDATLEDDIPLGISNQYIGKEAEISVKNGMLLLVLVKDSYYE